MTADFLARSRVDHVGAGLALAALDVHSPREAHCLRWRLNF